MVAAYGAIARKIYRCMHERAQLTATFGAMGNKGGSERRRGDTVAREKEEEEEDTVAIRGWVGIYLIHPREREQFQSRCLVQNPLVQQQEKPLLLLRPPKKEAGGLPPLQPPPPPQQGGRGRQRQQQPQQRGHRRQQQQAAAAAETGLQRREFPRKFWQHQEICLQQEDRQGGRIGV